MQYKQISAARTATVISDETNRSAGTNQYDRLRQRGSHEIAFHSFDECPVVDLIAFAD
jgi:hypothetical protein